MTHETYETVTIRHPRMLFLSFALGYILSVWASSFGEWQYNLIILVIPLLFLLISGKKALLLVLISTLWITLGGYLTLGAYEHQIDDWKYINQITQAGQQKVWIQGTIDKALYNADFDTSYRLRIDNIDTSSTQYRHENLGIIVQIPSNLSVKTGDILSFTGKILPILSTSMKGFERYAFGQQVYGKILLPRFDRIDSAKPSLFDQIQTWSVETFFRGFPREVASILWGMVLGNTSLLSSGTKDAFILSWISHILVVSGSNIAFVILLMVGILRYVPVRTRWKVTIVVFFVLLYSTLVGWEVSVIRATVMGILSFLAVWWGKRASSVALLCLTALLLLLYNPLSLAYDAGFGLSFGATLGILLFHEPFEKILLKVRTPKWLISMFTITLSASLWSLPVMIYHFGELSSGSLIANLLIAAVLWWVMITSVFYLVLAMFGSYFLYVFGFLVYIPAKYILMVSAFFSLSGTIKIPELWQGIIPALMFGYFLIEVLIREGERLSQAQKGSHSQ